LLVGLVNQERPVLQIHLGGGSPNFLTPSEILKLGQIIKNNFNISQNVEAGVEIDPRTTTLEHLEAFKNAGFNRVSMGIQDHDPQVQKAVHRIQPKELNQQVINWIRQTGFKSLNIDLIYGLPYQNPQSFAKTLNEVIQFNPDRFAVFNFAYVPWLKKHQLALKNLPSPETKLELLKLAIETLTAAGYVYIGMDHFAKSTDELAIAQKNHTLQRNFQGYSTHAGADILAFGMSSISQTDSFYRQNTKDINEYYAFLDSGKIPHKKGYILNNDDILRRKTIMRLMCDMELDFNYMSKMLNIDFPQYFKSELISLKEMEQDELVQILPTGLKVTQMGRLLIRNIAMKFDKYSNATPTTHFSKTI
jgi:oxygen-independent coproporphyrinogen-3 oxidase